MARRDQRYLSSWLQWALTRPNSAIRDEVVAATHASVPVNVLEVLAREMLENPATEDKLESQIARTLLEAARLAQSAASRREKETLVKVPLIPLEAVVDRFGLLPKGIWISSFCKAEKAHGRRTLVYVRQTGTRDIQDRLESVLKLSGVQAITLYGSVAPRRRERWIEDHSFVDTLTTNPRLVQTGLDLVSFQTIVFFEPEYSHYTLWQELRRVWRLGQTQPVKAIFAVYKDAMEAQALALMGRKMRAAQTLYVDEVGGAIVPVEGGDFITELAREVLRGVELDDLQSLFADEMRVCKLDEGQRHSPMGCPTEIGPVLIPVSPKTWLD
jgi:SNF2 family DNA or RNA helicase